MDEGKKREGEKIYGLSYEDSYDPSIRQADSSFFRQKLYSISCGHPESFVSPGMTFSYIHSLKFVTSNAKTHKIIKNPQDYISVFRVLEGSL